MKTIVEYLQSGHIISKELDYVDLDLPSGTLWAKMNIGAAKGYKPEDWYGLYFAWGETNGYKASDKHDFSWDNWHFTKDATKLKKDDDPVYHYTKGEYRMPTNKELEELYKYTDHKWISDYNDIPGLNGMIFISKADETKFIFIPASGLRNSAPFHPGYELYLWSSILDIRCKDYAYHLFAEDCFVEVGRSFLCWGYPVRGVLLNK